MLSNPNGRPARSRPVATAGTTQNWKKRAAASSRGLPAAKGASGSFPLGAQAERLYTTLLAQNGTKIHGPICWPAGLVHERASQNGPVDERRGGQVGRERAIEV